LRAVAMSEKSSFFFLAMVCSFEGGDETVWKHTAKYAEWGSHSAGIFCMPIAFNASDAVREISDKPSAFAISRPR